MFLERFMEKLNIYGKINFTFRWGNRTLGISLDTTAFIFTCISLAVLIFWQEAASGWIGLGIISLFNFQGGTQYMVR